MGLSAIKDLRARTGAGILDCSQALKESGHNVEKALQWLKKKGLARAEKKAFREVRAGAVASYTHGGRIGVLVEVNVETDFAARGETFKTFVHQLCLHIAAMNPLFIRPEDVPEKRKKQEREVFLAQLEKSSAKKTPLPSQKPLAPQIQEKIIDGKIKKWLSEVCLMSQIFLSSSQGDKPQTTVEEELKHLVARLGENVVIRRFVRLELGEKE